MTRKFPLLKNTIFHLPAMLVALVTASLTAQVPPLVSGPVFGGTLLFEGLDSSVSGNRKSNKEYSLAFGYAQGDLGADNFFSHLDNLSGGDPGKVMSAMRGLVDAPWGCRSRSYGIAVYGHGTTYTLSREETTSLWANADHELGGEAVDFDVRSSVLTRLAINYSGTSGKFFYGTTFRLERWDMGNTLYELDIFSPHENLSAVKNLLDFDETKNHNLTYALDIFMGYELASGLRIGAQTNRVTTRFLGDVEEKPQLRAGLQIDLGSMAQLTVETDINETARMPFPVPQKSTAASLKIRANDTITFAIGAEQKTMEGQQTIRFGLNAWLTGKKYHLGAGFHFGGDRTPWGATWKIQ